MMSNQESLSDEIFAEILDVLPPLIVKHPAPRFDELMSVYLDPEERLKLRETYQVHCNFIAFII